MTIRSTAKAAIVQNDKILLQCCIDSDTGLAYYELPGGGQNPHETMEQAVVRECLEETGYHIEIIRFLALSEEIITLEKTWRDYPSHAHRIFHIFLCRLTDAPPAPHSEEDTHQIDIRWFPLAEVPHLRLRPTNLRAALLPLLKSDEIGYLGISILESFDV